MYDLLYIFNNPADLKNLKLINISTLFLSKTEKFEHFNFQQFYLTL